MINEHNRLRKMMKASKKDKRSSKKFTLGAAQVDRLIKEYDELLVEPEKMLDEEPQPPKITIVEMDGGNFDD